MEFANGRSINTIRQALEHLLDTGLYSDVTFAVGPNGYKMNAHKVVIMARSVIFAVAFQNRWDNPEDYDKDKAISIPNTTEEGFKLFLKYIYTDEFEPTGTIADAIEVLKLAHMYEVQDLFEKCCEFLMANLNSQNCMEIYLTMQVYPEVNLSSAALDFMQWNITELIENNYFLHLDMEGLKFLLNSDQLDIAEYDLFKALLRWGNTDVVDETGEPCIESRQIIMKKLVTLIRFPLMDPGDFATEVVPTNLLSDKAVVEIFSYFLGGVNKPTPTTVSAQPRRFKPEVTHKISSVQCFDFDILDDVPSVRPDNYYNNYNAYTANHHIPEGLGLGDGDPYYWNYGPNTQTRTAAITLNPQLKFNSKQDIFIHGLRVYGVTEMPDHNYRYNYNVQYSIRWRNPALSLAGCLEDEGNVNVIGEITKSGTFDVYLPRPFEIKADKWYWISANRLISVSVEGLENQQQQPHYSTSTGYIYNASHSDHYVSSNGMDSNQPSLKFPIRLYGCSDMKNDEIATKLENGVTFEMAHTILCHKDSSRRGMSSLNPDFRPIGVIHSILFSTI